MSLEENGDKVEKVERELEDFKSSVSSNMDELKEAVSELKNSIVEIRAAISEIENPFNLLKAVSSEEELAKHLEVEGQPEALEREAEVEEVSEGPAPVEALPRPDLKEVQSLIKWVWKLLDMGFDEKDVRNLSTTCELFGLLPKGSSGFIHELSLTVSKARELGLSEDAFVLGVLCAAKASGLKLELEDAWDMIFRVMNKDVILRMNGQSSIDTRRR